MWLNINHLQKLYSQSKIINFIEFIEYLAAKNLKLYSNKDQFRKIKIRDLMSQKDGKQLKLLWDNFLESWNGNAKSPSPTAFAEAGAETPQQFIVFNDEALLSYFIEIEETTGFLSIESALRWFIFLIQQLNYKNGVQQYPPKLKEEDDTQDSKVTTALAINVLSVQNTNYVSANPNKTIISFGQSRSEGEPETDLLIDASDLNDDQGFRQRRLLNLATIDSDSLYRLFNFLSILEIDNNKPRRRKITSLRQLLNISIPNDVLKSSMKQFKSFTKDVLFGKNIERKLHQIQIEWQWFSDELLISLVLAFSDRMPSKAYPEAISIEIGRLESVGESIIEQMYVVYAVTNPENWSLQLNDLENLRIQTLKVSNLNELAKHFNLDRMLFTNQQVQSDAPKRELSAIVNSIVGALGLWAGVEPVFHFLQLLNVIQKDKKKRQESTQQWVHNKKIEGKEENKEGGSFSGQIQKEENSELNVDDIPEFLTSEEEKDDRFYNQSQDYLIPKQLYEYGNQLSSSLEMKQFMKKTPDYDEIQKKVAMILTSNEQTKLPKRQRVIYNLALFDSSFNDSLFMETDIGKTQEFLRGNLSNLKLKMIGQSFISMMYKVRMYFETIDFTNLELKSAKNIEAQVSQIMLASWHSYGLFTKFLKISRKTENPIPMVISESNQQLKQKINEFSLLFLPYQIPSNDLQSATTSDSMNNSQSTQFSNNMSFHSTSYQTNDSSNTQNSINLLSASTASSINNSLNSQNMNNLPQNITSSQMNNKFQSQIVNNSPPLVSPSQINNKSQTEIVNNLQSNLSPYATNYTLKSYTSHSSDKSTLFVDDKKQEIQSQFFTSKEEDKMSEIAENFIPEYSNVLLGLIGAKFIQSIGNLKETSELAEFLLMHNSDKDSRFPIFTEMKNFYSNLWNANSYSRILKLHYSVEHIKGGSEKKLYYKVYIDMLEIRRFKFKMSQPFRHQCIFKDVQQYIEAGNKVFQEYQKIEKFPLSPCEYITFHQEYRKFYKVGATFESLFKLMEPFYSKRKKIENNPYQRIQSFLTNIKQFKRQGQGRGQFSSKYILTKQIIELMANQIESDLKNDSCRATDNVQTGQKELLITEYIDQAIKQLVESKKQSKNPQEEHQYFDNQGILEQIYNETYMTRCSHGHLFNEEETYVNTESFSSKYIFSEKSSNEDVLKLFEHISEQYQ